MCTQISGSGVKVWVQVVIASLNAPVHFKVGVILVSEGSGRVPTLMLPHVSAGRSQREQLHVVGGGVALTLVVAMETGQQ